jgi:phosphoribosylamine--glycine ligase
MAHIMPKGSRKKFIVVGQGGREHALSRALSLSPGTEVLVSPGNPGMDDGRLKFLDGFPDDPQEASRRILALNPDVVIVGPEKPLVAGLVDCLENLSVRVVGPTADAARIEGSKLFAKEIMKQSGIPTADFSEVTTIDEIRSCLKKWGYPLVLKEDGLAQGKGVWVMKTDEDLNEVLERYFDRNGKKQNVGRIFAEKGLSGPEVSYIVMTDGESFLPFPTARDFKRIGDRDTGPNTGGMGALTPVPGWTASDDESARMVIDRCLWGLRKNGTPFKGFLYAGLMKTPSGIMVLEFNARFGDPEAQVLVPQVGESFADLMEGLAKGSLPLGHEFKGKPTVGVVLASPGYPEKPVTGGRIIGLDKVNKIDSVTVYSAGISLFPGGRKTDLVSSGGRVLTVSAESDSLSSARALAYSSMELIHLPGGQYRSDIALLESTQVP